ncbi:hypothetical protein QAD02_011437 [Eretmocerus hayati]|uniref:Uncharacterized protein n=1 Tax=Eretmocerus hayati TaxID=131215 RepID=A0ACC2NWY2_9HYME|nr:hypothetical protein QAD02_011437 [Eretmocerus hayati]
MTDSSILMDDSDEDEMMMASRCTGPSSAAKTMIQESDTEEEDSDRNAEDAQSIDSEEEDLQFLNSSHRVSILEHTSDSESEAEPTVLSKMKRRSTIYDDPESLSEKSVDPDTPITMPARKKAKNILYSDSESEDNQMPTDQPIKKNLQGLLSDDESDDDEPNKGYHHEKSQVYSKILIEDDDEMPSSKPKANELDVTPNSPTLHVPNDVADASIDDSSTNKSVNTPVHGSPNISESPRVRRASGSPSLNIFGNISKDSVILLDSSDDDMDQDADDISKKLSKEDDVEKKKQHLLSCIDRTQTQLNKLNRFAESVDINQLPDKGEKVFDSIEEQKEKLAQLKRELAVLTRVPIASPLQTRNISSVPSPYNIQKKRLGSPSRDQENVDVQPKIKLEGVTPLKIHSPVKNGSGLASKYESHSDGNKFLSIKKEMFHSSPNVVRLNGNHESDEKLFVKKQDPYQDSSEDYSDEDESGEYDEDEHDYDSYEGYSEDEQGAWNRKLFRKSFKKKRQSMNKSEFWENRPDFDLGDIPTVPKRGFRLADLGDQALNTLLNQQSLTHDRLSQLHKSLTTRPAEDYREQDPPGLKIPLMPHQQHALAWMKWRETQNPRGGILADDMGLGKTLSMISLVLATINEKHGNDSDSDSDDEWISRKKHKRVYGKTLVVCPASLLQQWEKEVKKRCNRGILTTYLLHGPNRVSDERKLARYNIVITTYQILVNEHRANSKMYQMEWNRVILDEAHFVRNHKSQASVAVCGLRGRYKWALTGTPIQNKEMDLYAILKFLECSPFDELPVWRRWVDNKNDAGKQRLIALMKSLMLRRTKQELQTKGTFKTLPDKTVHQIEIDMDEEEKAAYQKILLYSRTLFAQFLAQRGHDAGKIEKPTLEMVSQFTRAQRVMLDSHDKVSAHEILVLILRLRQMCCHPALIHAMLDQEDAEISGIASEELNSNVLGQLNSMSIHEEDEGVEDFVAEFRFNEKVTSNLLSTQNPVFDDDRCSSKVRAIIKKIEELLETGDKIVVVSQWTGFLKVIAKNLDNIDDARYAMFTGEVEVKKRQPIVDRFNDSDEENNVLLLSLTAGGVGLNLIGGNHLLLIDIHWNPQLENQAQDRIYRFGQKKNVHVYKFICRDTIEFRVKYLQDKKLDIANHVLTGTRSMSSKLTIEDLKTLFS